MTDNPQSVSLALLFRMTFSTIVQTSDPPPVSRASNFNTDSTAKSASRLSPPEKEILLHSAQAFGRQPRKDVHDDVVGKNVKERKISGFVERRETNAADAVAVVCLAPVGCDQVVGVERHLGRRPLLWSTSSGSAQSRSGSINDIKLFCLYLHLTNVFVNYCKILTLK